MSQESSYGIRFVAEAREHLATMTAAMIALERNESGPAELVETLLRAAHSIKGGAGFAGRHKVEQLAHALEEAFECIRDGALARTPEVVDVLLAALDRIVALVDDIDHSNDADISGPLTRLQSLTASRSALSTLAPASGQARSDSRGTPELQPGEFNFAQLAATTTSNRFIYGVKLDWFECEQNLALAPAEIVRRLDGVGEVVESQTKLGGAALFSGMPTAPAWLLAMVSSPLAFESFRTKLNIPCARILSLREGSSVPTEGEEEKPAAKPRAPQAATSLRIAVPLIDRMMALAGELVLVRNQAMRAPAGDTSALNRLLRRLDTVTNELQDAALRLRTQPVGILFDRFPRMVRDLARQLGKQIDIEVIGSEVELDKTIIELLADPLTHLVRNCCDHGIESIANRAAAGKPAAGRITLSAKQERGQIVIEVRDDGRGIDADALKQKAIERGVKQRAELDSMSPRQIFDLILLSGFSTANRVTDISGRGVGMDVVRSNLDQIGGVIEIDSARGMGSIFTMRLPLTLAIMPCLLVETQGQCYALPQRDIEQILLLDPSTRQRSIELDHDGEVLRWREMLLPVVRLREALRRRKSFDAAIKAEIAATYHAGEGCAEKAYGAVIRMGTRRFVLVFDQVLQSENIVVKPLPPLLRPLGIYAATTILGDGSVSLILNSEGLARHGGALVRSPALDAPLLTLKSEKSEERHVMLFRSGPRELLALGMESVRRVVMITPGQIERIGDRELINVDDAAINLVRPERYLNLSSCTDAKYLILPRNSALPVGLLASEIVDTPLLHLELDPLAYQAEGVTGSAMIRGEIALFLDINTLLRLWQAEHPPRLPGTGSPAAPRILLVEDTAFFQKLVADHLRSAGYDVAVVVNGSEGLEKLRASRFDLVISDVEMPVMDGLTLARRVREDPRYATLPLVALTTLNTAESRAAAAAAGFDAYEVKLAKESLLKTVRGLLNASRSSSESGASHA